MSASSRGSAIGYARWLGAAATLLVTASCSPAGPSPAEPRPRPEPEAPALPPVRPVEGLPGREPLLRIGIAVGAEEVTVGAGSAYRIVADGRTVEAPPEATWTFRAGPDQRLTAQDASGRILGPFAGPVTVETDGGGTVLIGGEPYRGQALLLPAGSGRVTAVNTVDMEAYLLGVVPREIGRRPPEEIEAVKAQAVAARTYAIGHLGRRERLGFDLYATVADQVYGGAAAEDEVVSQAVRDTRGVILTYDGQPIQAYYHSTAGGHTASIGEAWPWADPVPYLRGVTEKVPGEDRWYDQASNRFRWSVSWTGERLREILGRTLARYGAPAGGIRRIDAIELTGRTPSGRAEALRIVADGRTYTVPGDSLRWVLQPEPDRLLNSSMILGIEAERAGGELSRLVVRGGGWGHGIGMSQWGAMGRARAGLGYGEILSTYYRGASLSRLY